MAEAVAKLLEANGPAGGYALNPTVSEIRKAIALVDKDKLYKLSGNESTKGRDKDEFRPDAVML